MKSLGQLRLGDRLFEVKRAILSRSGDLWAIDVESEPVEHDGEWWAPYIYHQGLKLAASRAAQLQGCLVMWSSPKASDYEHPEWGLMYVFGHHEIEDAVLEFGELSADGIALKWKGVADVLWSPPFSERVPFACACVAAVHEG